MEPPQGRTELPASRRGSRRRQVGVVRRLLLRENHFVRVTKAVMVSEARNHALTAAILRPLRPRRSLASEPCRLRPGGHGRCRRETLRRRPRMAPLHDDATPGRCVFCVGRDGTSTLRCSRPASTQACRDARPFPCRGTSNHAAWRAGDARPALPPTALPDYAARSIRGWRCRTRRSWFFGSCVEIGSGSAGGLMSRE